MPVPKPLTLARYKSELRYSNADVNVCHTVRCELMVTKVLTVLQQPKQLLSACQMLVMC
jgi:hypothetical protein